MRRVVQKRKRNICEKKFKKVNKEFKFLVLVLVRKSSIVKLKGGVGIEGTLNWESVIL